MRNLFQIQQEIQQKIEQVEKIQRTILIARYGVDLGVGLLGAHIAKKNNVPPLVGFAGGACVSDIALKYAEQKIVQSYIKKKISAYL